METQRKKLKGGIVLLSALLSISLSLSLNAPPVRATGLSWLMVPGATATYSLGAPYQGELQTWSHRVNVTESNGTHVTVTLESYERGSGWDHFRTHGGLAINSISSFWMKQGAAIGDTVNNILDRVTRVILNMTETVDEGTEQEAYNARLNADPFWEIFRIVYDRSCGLALYYTRRNNHWYLHETNVDLGPSVDDIAASNNLNAILMVLGAGAVVVVGVGGVAVLLRRRRGRA